MKPAIEGETLGILGGGPVASPDVRSRKKSARTRKRKEGGGDYSQFDRNGQVVG